MNEPDRPPPRLPPPPLVDFLQLYGEGRYWESHEALEGPWRATGSPFYQGLILYASAFVHWERGNAHGVRAQLRKALERWADHPSPYLGLDLDRIRRHCRAVRDTVASSPGSWRDRVAPLPLEVDAGSIRGDEEELEERG